MQSQKMNAQPTPMPAGGFRKRPRFGPGAWIYRLISAILVCVGMCGCARFRTEPLAPAKTAASLEQRSLTNGALRVWIERNLERPPNPWPPPSWDLNMLTLAALYYHPDIEVARAEWATAQSSERTARQRANPTVTITPGFNSTTTTPSPWIPLGLLDWPIETAGKRKYRRAKAAQLAKAARLKLIHNAWQVRSRLRSSLLHLEGAERRHALLQEQLALQNKILQLAEQQAQAGAVASSELLPLRIALIKLQLDAADAQSARAEARARVSESIGIPIEALEGIQFSWDWNLPRTPQLITAETRRNALLSRTDILSSLADYAAAEAELQLQIAKQYPDVHLQPGYQYDQGDNKWSLGLVMELPVLNQNQGPIAEAEAKRHEAAARFEAVQAGVLAEIERNTELLRVAEQTADSLDALATAQSQRRDSLAAQYAAGAVAQVEVLNAQSELIAAELVRLEGRLKWQEAAGALEDALQQPIHFPAAVFESSLTAPGTQQ